MTHYGRYNVSYTPQASTMILKLQCITMDFMETVQTCYMVVNGSWFELAALCI